MRCVWCIKLGPLSESFIFFSQSIDSAIIFVVCFWSRFLVRCFKRIVFFFVHRIECNMVTTISSTSIDLWFHLSEHTDFFHLEMVSGKLQLVDTGFLVDMWMYAYLQSMASSPTAWPLWKRSARVALIFQLLQLLCFVNVLCSSRDEYINSRVGNSIDN